MLSLLDTVSEAALAWLAIRLSRYSPPLPTPFTVTFQEAHMNYFASLALSLPDPAKLVTSRVLTISKDGDPGINLSYSIPVDATSFVTTDPLADTLGELTFTLVTANAAGSAASVVKAT
ncbi:MAG: hypothetical protein EBW47_00560, partial [Betaproteobacteria bacterium]|nr:hypothetical protein [Betaproteobacteria bacterium]